MAPCGLPVPRSVIDGPDEEIETLKKENPDNHTTDISWREQHIADLDNIISNFDKDLTEE